MAVSQPPHTLSLSVEEMRRVGYRIIDRLIDHTENLHERKVTYAVDRAELKRDLSEPPPEAGSDFESVLDSLEGTALANFMHVDHPRFFAYIPGPSNYVSVLADALAAGLNIFAGTWLASAGPSQIELVVVDWLRQICGLPESTGGLFVSGGSMANVTALAVARHVKLNDVNDGGVVYFSDQTHSSVMRGLRLLGFQVDQMRSIETDDAFRMDVNALRQAITADRESGRRPFCIIANAGTTNTGAVDPLPELADLCDEQDLWLHVDGAYGAAAALCERGRALLTGLERAHSVALDPHKWLFQPFETGCVLVREQRWLGETFRITPDYLRDAHRTEPEMNFCDYGVQLTRSARALKVWLSMKVFGLGAFRQAVARGFELAEYAESVLRASGCWEIVTPAQLAIVSFRYAPAQMSDEAAESVNGRLVDAIFRDGYAMISSTRLRGRTVLRFCTINPRTSERDIASTIDRIARLAETA